jgi:hypothetical protein
MSWRVKDYKLWDCGQKAMGLPPATSAVSLVKCERLGNMRCLCYLEDKAWEICISYLQLNWVTLTGSMKRLCSGEQVNAQMCLRKLSMQLGHLESMSALWMFICREWSWSLLQHVTPAASNCGQYFLSIACKNEKRTYKDFIGILILP